MSENETYIRRDLVESLGIAESIIMQLKKVLANNSYDTGVDHVYSHVLACCLREAETAAFDISSPVVLEVK